MKKRISRAFKPDAIHSKDNYPATDRQLGKLLALRKATGCRYTGDFDAMKRGSCGREIRALTLKLKAKDKPHKYTKELWEGGKIVYRF